jgi:hypothetical protein
VASEERSDLMSVATVCRRCYEVSNDGSLWRALKFIGRTSTADMIRLLLRKSPGLRYLEVVGRTTGTAIIEEVCIPNEKLRTLIFKRCMGEPNVMCIKYGDIYNIPKYCTDLENVTIKGSYTHTHTHTILSFVSSWVKLFPI